MKLSDLMEHLTEGRSPKEKALAEIKSARVILSALERDLKTVSRSSSRSDKNRVEQHVDEVVFAMERAGKAIREELG